LRVFGSRGIEVKRHGTLSWELIIYRAEGIGKGEAEDLPQRSSCPSGYRGHGERREEEHGMKNKELHKVGQSVPRKCHGEGTNLLIHLNQYNGKKMDMSWQVD
jgi:hypothetical protein